MGNIRVVSSALLALAVAACGDDGGSNTPDALVIVDAAPIDTAPPIDQPPAVNYDLTCLNNTAPTTIPATVSVAGTAQEINGMAIAAAAGVTVRGCLNNCAGADELAEVGPTDTSGAFSTGNLTTNGQALDGYIIASKQGYWDTRLYPHAPLAENLTGAPVLMVTQSQVGQLAALFQFTQSPGNGVVVLAVTDCAATPAGVDGAVVSAKQGGTDVGEDPIDAGLLAGVAGAFLIPNVPPGETTLTATYNGMTFLVNNVTVVANSLTTAQVKPGY